MLTSLALLGRDHIRIARRRGPFLQALQNQHPDRERLLLSLKLMTSDKRAAFQKTQNRDAFHQTFIPQNVVEAPMKLPANPRIIP